MGSEVLKAQLLMFIKKLPSRLGVFSFGLLCFLLPLKFGLPFVASIQPILPVGLKDWMFYCWPNELVQNVIFIYAFVWLCRGVAKGRLQWRVQTASVAALVFFAAAGISCFFTQDHFRTYQNGFLLLSYGAFYFFALNNLRRKHARFIVGCVAASASVVIVYGIYQYFIGLEETRQWVYENLDLSHYPKRFGGRLNSNRIFSTLVYPNALGCYLAMTAALLSGVFFYMRSRFEYYLPVLVSAVITVWVAAESDNASRAALGVLICCLYPLVVFPAFYLTVSNGAFVSFGLALAGGGAAFGRKKLVLSVCVVGVLGVAAFLLRNSAAEVIKIASVKARVEYWIAGFKMIVAHPFFGTGPGTFGAVYPQYILPGAEETQMAHNNYLQVWIESGTLAFVAFASFWVVSLGRVFAAQTKQGLKTRNARLMFCLLLGAAAFAVHNLLDFSYYIPALTLLATVMLVLALLLAGPCRVRTLRVPNIILRWCIVAVLSFSFTWVVVANTARGYASYLLSFAHKTYTAGHVKQAVMYAKTAVAFNPYMSPAWFFLGVVYDKAGNKKQAAYFYYRAVEQSPLVSSYRAALGVALLNNPDNDPVAGARQLAFAHKFFPGSPKYKKLLDECMEMYGFNARDKAHNASSEGKPGDG